MAHRALKQLAPILPLLAGVLLVASLCPPSPVQAPGELFFEAPVGERPSEIRPGGETVLPNGRLITPRGRQIFTAPHPYGLALSRDGKTAVTVNSGTKPFSATLISLSAGDTRQILAPVKAAFMGALFSPDGATVYLSGGNDGSVLVLDTRDGRILSSIPLNDAQWRDSYVGEIAGDAGGRYLYACDQANFRVAVIDAAARRVVSSARVGRYPFAVSLAPEGRRLYVANAGMFEYSPVPGGLSFPPFGFPSREARDGARAEGKEVPGLGDPNAPESFSVWELDVADPAAPRVLARIKTGILVGAASNGVRALGGSAPSAVAAGRRQVYVSNANNDLVSVIDRATGKVVREIALALSPETARLRGVIPFGLALSPDESRLYVAEAGINAVAVIDTARGRVLGHIPAGWFPSKLAVSPDGRTLCVANAKGYGSGPNGGPGFQPVDGSSYIGDIQRGMVSVMALPPGEELAGETRRVMLNNGLVARTAPAPPAAFGQIRYVVYVVKENRTFDEVFGALRRRDTAVRGDPSLVHLGPAIMPNHHALAQRFALADNFYVDSDVSADGHRWAVGVYPNAWVETSWPASYGKQRDVRRGSTAPGRRGFTESNSSVHPEDYLEAGSLWEHLERHGIAFRNYGEGFELAGNDEDAPHLPTGALLPFNIPMPEALFRNTCRNYPGFNMNVSDQYRFERFAEEFREFEKPGRDLPRLIFMHLPNDHMTKERPAAGYPRRESYAADNDYALGRLIELLSGSRFWSRMCVFITEDDAQGGRDHVDAHRSLLLVAGPYARPGRVSHAHTSFGSILKTIELIFGLPYLNLYDATALDLRDFFDSEAHLEPYRALPPDKALFDPARVREGAAPVRQVLDDPQDLRRQLRATPRK
jgi:YVTN family beta-propeller protein